MTAAIELRDLSRRYGAALAVDGVTLDIAAGEFAVLLGPSGCGKTTTLRMIAGFVEPSAGSVRIGGRDVTREPPWRRQVGLVFQGYALFPHLSVFENVAFGLRRRRVPEGEIRERVRRALALVRLDGFAERMPRAMSGGQQQRVALARAVVVEPAVLLLDEPLSGLDAKLRLEVRDELRALQRGLGLTAVMVTHDQEEAMAAADRLVVMNGGRVRQVGPPDAVYRRPAGRFVAGFVGRGSFLPGRAEGDAFVTAAGVRIPCEALAPGATTLLVRPEAVSLHRAGVPGGVPATVERATFLGAAAELRLRLPGGEALDATAPPGGWAAGEAGWAVIDRTAAVGLAPEAEERA